MPYLSSPPCNLLKSFACLVMFTVYKDFGLLLLLKMSWQQERSLNLVLLGNLGLDIVVVAL